jgi:hypothetical protein
MGRVESRSFHMEASACVCVTTLGGMNETSPPTISASGCERRCKQSKQSKNLCSRFSGRHGSATERLSDGATGPTGLCALRAHHTRLIKTGDYQARSFTALEAAM